MDAVHTWRIVEYARQEARLAPTEESMSHDIAAASRGQEKSIRGQARNQRREWSGLTVVDVEVASAPRPSSALRSRRGDEIMSLAMDVRVGGQKHGIVAVERTYSKKSR